jgi:uncharacterized membrane protein YgcG
MTFRNTTNDNRGWQGARESGHRRAIALSTLVALLATFGWSVASAQDDPSPIPEFTGARVYVSGVRDEFDVLREDISRLERSSPQTYYVCVIRSSGPDKRSTRTYLERMVEQWESQARRRGVKFDKERSVIILVATENRQVIVLGGEQLQEQLGFRDPYIERDLLRPHFFPYARSKEYVRGLRVLVAQIDRWIAEHDKNLTRHREDEVAREARLKGDAQSAVNSAKRLIEETRTELNARKATGLQVETLEARIRKAQDDLDAAGRRIDTSAGEALDLAQQSQRELQGVFDELRKVSARQADIDQLLRKAAASSGEVLKAVEQAGRDGLPVAPVQAELDAANTLIEQARQALKSDPEKAASLVTQADGGLRDALEHARQLPELRREVEQKTKSVASLERSAKAELDRARGAGVAATDLLSAWEQANKSLSVARATAGSDDRKALAAFKGAESALNDVLAKSEARLTRHRFATRTLPLCFLAGVAAAVFGVLGLLWYRKRRLQQLVDKQFKGFREQAVALMDKLDALRHRHKTMSATDPDFTQPLAGSTLTLYNAVEKDLNGLWERWLRVMEVWDQAQKLVRAGSGLAIQKTEEAKKLIEQEGNFEELLRQCNSCEERLDRLNQGHETAREALKTARDELTTFRKTLDEITAAGFPAEPYTRELSTVEGLLAQAEGLLQADPIGAGEVIAHSREALGSLAKRSTEVLARIADAKAALASIDEVVARASELRSQGLKLTEDQADPDPRLDQARRAQAAALEALRKADPVAAGPRINEARSLTDQARQAIDRSLAARDIARKELTARRDALPAIRQTIDRTAAILDELRRSAAPESWGEVAGNLDQARSLLQANEDWLARAEADASDRAQNYIRAASTLAHVASDQARTDKLLLAVADRQSALAELARQSRELSTRLEGEVHEADAFFRANEQAVGPEARRSLERTEQSYHELAALLNERLPNWPEIRRRIDVVHQGAAVALRQGREDVEGFRRVTQKLEQVKQKAETIGSLLRQEDKDRPPANQRYRTAVAALNQFERGDESGATWDRLLGRLGEVEGNLDRAQTLANEDISLANGAIAEIAESDRAIREARAFYESGVTVDVSEAEGQLARARGALATQAYEQAIDHANAAEQAAYHARQVAAHEARRRRMRNEREHVFSSNDAALVIAAAQAAARAAGHWIGSGSGPVVSFPPSVPSFPDSGASTGTWGSDSGQGNWTEGADQAGW